MKKKKKIGQKISKGGDPYKKKKKKKKIFFLKVVFNQFWKKIFFLRFGKKNHW
jgi:hypothetical protein